MDLQTGTFSLENFPFGPDTDARALYDALANRLRGALLPDGSGVLRLRDPVPLAGTEWRVELDFLRGKPQRAVLRPLLPDAPAARREAEDARRAFCDRLLRDALGQPDSRTEGCTLYRRPYGTVCAVSDTDPRGMALLGCLVLTYGGGEG